MLELKGVSGFSHTNADNITTTNMQKDPNLKAAVDLLIASGSLVGDGLQDLFSTEKEQDTPDQPSAGKKVNHS